MSLHHIHFFLLDVVHVLHEVLSSLQVLDSLVGTLLLLKQLDDSGLDGRLLIFDLSLVNHCLHHVSLGGRCTECAHACRHHLAAVDQG